MISLNNKEQQGNVSRSYKLYKHTSPFMYDLDGRYITSVDSFMEAKRLYNAYLRPSFFHNSDVKQSCGFQWTIKKFDTIPPYSGYKRKYNTNIKEGLQNGKQD